MIVSLTGTARERPAIGHSSLPTVITEDAATTERTLITAARVSRRAGAATAQAGTLEYMLVPSKRLKDLIEGTVDHHASLTCPDLQELTIRCAARSATNRWAGEGDDNYEQIPLCRIQYLGDDDHWAFVIYDPATEPTPTRSCAPANGPATPGRIRHRRHHHLADYQQKPSRRCEPERNLRALH